MPMRHIIAIRLQNEAGALTRVAGLFSTRGYNIESLSVAPTEDPTVSRITLVSPPISSFRSITGIAGTSSPDEAPTAFDRLARGIAIDLAIKKSAPIMSPKVNSPPPKIARSTDVRSRLI